MTMEAPRHVLVEMEAAVVAYATDHGAEAGTVVPPLLSDDPAEGAGRRPGGDHDGSDGARWSPKRLYRSCLTTDPAKVTPQSLWIAMWSSLVSLAAFCSCLVVLILMVQERGRAQAQGAAAARQPRAPNASYAGAINYTAAQERWVDLRDRLNLTLYSAESPQAKALRYLSLAPAVHDAAQQYAVAVLFYGWAGPYWNLQNRAEYRPEERWMPDPGAPPATGEGGPGNAALGLECSWKGIGCDDGGRVASINLTELNAFNFPQGTIPTEIGMLSGLTALAVPDHGLQGTIPTELAALRALRELNLRGNKLSGAKGWIGSLLLPAGGGAAGTAPALERLRLGYNALRDSWGAPEWEALAGCSSLVELDLGSNLELASDSNLVDLAGAWPMLEILTVGQTRLAFSLNDQVLAWSRLQILDADGARLSGTLSPFLSPEIRALRLNPGADDPGLEGSIPTQIGLWTRLEELILDYNDALSTTIPTEIGQATSIRLLSVKFNPHVTGTIPTELGRLPRLEIVDLRACQVTGTVPAELANCPNLRSIRIESTPLVGSMPAELCDGSHNWTDLTASCESETVEGGGSDPSRFFACDCCTYCQTN